MFDPSLVRKVSFTSEYPQEHPHDDGRYFITCEFTYGELGHSKREITLEGDDNLSAFIELLEAIPMTKNVNLVRHENGFSYLQGEFEVRL